LSVPAQHASYMSLPGPSCPSFMGCDSRIPLSKDIDFLFGAVWLYAPASAASGPLRHA
jgi:hypothetical protein